MDITTWENLLPQSNCWEDCAASIELLPEGYLGAATDLSSSTSSDDPDWEMEERHHTYDGDVDWELEAEETDHTYYDDDGADVPEGSRLQKNKKERERVKQKKESLRELVSILKASSLVSDADKKRRFTEAYTVCMTTALIKVLEDQNRRRLGGSTSRRHQQQLVTKKKRKTSNGFIKFSARFRPCFVEMLNSNLVHVSGKNPSQKVVQRLSADVWHRLPPAARQGSNWESKEFESQVTELAKSVVYSPSHH